MYILNYLKLWYVFKRKPRLLSVALDNLWGQFIHPYKKRKPVARTPPEQITIMTTDICNFRCRMCQYAHSDSDGYRLNQVGHMRPEVFFKLLEEIPGRPLVSFTGGEPLLNPNTIDYIAAAHARGCPTTLTTNGWFLAKHAEKIRDAGLDLLVCSVDGPPEIHNHVRGKNAFERLEEGLKKITQLRNRPVVFVNMAMSDLNYRHLVSTYEQAVRFGVDGMNINHLWMQAYESIQAYNVQFLDMFAADQVAWDIHPEKIDVQQLASDMAKIRYRNRMNRMVVSEAPYLRGSELRTWYQKPSKFVKWSTTRCAWMRMKVWPDGSVKPCREWKVGNVLDMPAMEIWSSQRFRSFRNLLAEQGAIPICSRCCYIAQR